MSDEQKRKSSNAQDFFLYLLMFLALSFLAFGSGSILFQFVSKILPDQISNFFDQSGVRFGIAALFIAGPIFFLVSNIIVKRISDGAIAIDSGVRRWLTYIVLFFAAATVIGDLIALIFNFLNGETTIQFLLKVLIVLIIAGSIFTFYFWDMRKNEVDGERKKINKIATLSAGAFLAVVFVGAFFIVDSPNLAREKRIDEQTVNDVQAIDNSVRSFFNQSGKLPTTLADLEKTGFSPYLQSASNIDYLMTGENAYKLCASFVRSNIDDKDVFLGNVSSVEWKHAGGNFCFERIALKENSSMTPLK